MKHRQWTIWIRRLLVISGFGLIFLVVTLWAINCYVSRQSQQFIYYHIDEVPYRKTGLLLGTSKYVTNGNQNLFYSNRIAAAVALFEAKKIDYIIVSGDNRYLSYNEPRLMQQDLVNAGIPEDRVIPDYAGFRTFDSVIRSKKVFLQDTVTIISQAFHLERALYIAHQNNMDAIGFAAAFPDHDWAYKVLVREYFARVALMLDLYVNHTEPRFLGEEIPIGRDSL